MRRPIHPGLAGYASDTAPFAAVRIVGSDAPMTLQQLAEKHPTFTAEVIREHLPRTMKDKFRIKVVTDPFNVKVQVTFTLIKTDQTFITVLREDGSLPPEFEAMLCTVV